MSSSSFFLGDQNAPYRRSMTPLIILSLVLILTGDVCSLEYNLAEELPVGTVIGNVKQDSNLTSQYSEEDSHRLRFHLRPVSQTQQRYFSVDEKTGDIITTQVLDRETLCPYTQELCDLAFDVSIRPIQFYQVVKVLVHVVDVNDNWPTFPSDGVTLSVSETALPGAMFMIPAAEDADSGSLGIQQYRLPTGHSDENPFQLVVTDQVDGAKDVRLRLTGRLDREKIDHYRLTVEAIDGGDPAKTGSIRIDINVLDSNDNSPQFENATYRVEISEDLPATSTLLRVHATDPDQGPNGVVRYSLADQTEAAYGRTFGVDERTGDLFLKSPVDFEQHRSFQLTVQASDSGSGSLPVFAIVEVDVVDVNDNPPQITVNVLTDSDFAQVRENVEPGTFVAHAAVKDADSGRNGQVECFIDNRSQFALEALYHSEYKITTAVVFDREEAPDHELVLTCRDKGDTPLTSSSTIQVLVLDENDNDPDLGLSSDPYVVRLLENNPANSTIVRINATDRDEGKNSALVYRIQPVDGTPEGVLFVDPILGRVSALRSLDYEERSQYAFLLTVSDRGDVPRSATATLQLTVLDSNDEKPLFDRSNYFMTVRENQPPGTIVGQLNATDRDVNSDFRRISYAFQTPNGVFDMDEQTGLLTTLRRLDREEQATYRLTVVASNRGGPSGIESRTNVTVFVDDENDNAPVFLFPGAGGVDTVELAGHSAVTGTVVTRLVAADRDVGENADLVYHINSGNVDDLFRIDPSTGVITLARRPPSVTHAPFDQVNRLVVVVRDHGQPQLMSVADLVVIFNHSLAAAQTGGSSDFETLLFEGHNILILVGAALGLVVVVSCVAVAIVCVRRHRRLVAKRAAFAMGSEVSHQHCKSPSFSTRASSGSRGGAGHHGGRFGSFASTVESASTTRRSASAGCSLLQQHHACDCEAAMMLDDETTYIDSRLTDDWTQMQQQDSGIISVSISP